jgi:hypothetical protein
MAGTMYGVTRALLSDNLVDLRAALNSRLAYLDEPADKGYQPFYFAIPTNRQADYPSGAIDLRMLAMPRAMQFVTERDKTGGSDGNALAMPWQATMTCKDPSITGALPQEYAYPDTTVKSSATAAAATDLISKAAHGLVAGDRVYFTVLTGGTGLSKNIAYYVIASGLTSGVFKVSTSSGGSAVNITVDYSSVSFVKVATVAGNLVNRGNYPAPLNMIFAVSALAGTIVGSAGGSIFTITVPASTGARIIRFKGADKIITVEEDDVESLAMGYLDFSSDTTWPSVVSGTTAYSITVTGLVVDAGATDGSMLWFYEPYA